MGDRVSFSSQEQTLESIATHHSDIQASLFEYFSGNSQTLIDRHIGANREEARARSLAELDHTSSLSILSSVEAAIRLDYLYRVYDRQRDNLSRAMRALHKKRTHKARLADDLIPLWREHTLISKILLDELTGALKFRHWLAHGRYWTPKFGRKYDYMTVYNIAQEFIESMNDHNKKSG
jgi:hypothetical protein